MKDKQEFDCMMKATTSIALATSVDDNPNVRIVNCCYDESRPGIVYFSSVRSNPKTIEFEKNSKVAFTTIPAPSEGHVHIRTKTATVQKSKLSIDDVEKMFVEQIPGFDKSLAVIGRQLDIYEIHIKEAVIVYGPKQTGAVSF